MMRIAGVTVKPRVLVPILVAVAVLAAVWVVAFVRLPIFETDAYRSFVRDFDRAAIREGHLDSSQITEWEFQVPLPAGAVVATVRARGFMDVVRVQYSDEPDERQIYRYRDYSSPLQIRTAGNLLYVYWAVTLFRVDYSLLIYDLANRREVARRRVKYEDMPAVPSLTNP
jgi:hypothetical protein